MADVVKDVTDYINSQEGEYFDWLKRPSEGGVGTLFMLDMPPTPDSAMAVFQYSGESPRPTFGNPLQVRKPRIQVMIRDPKSIVILNRASAVLELLEQIKDQQINDTVYAKIKSVGEAQELGPDGEGRQRATVNFSVSYYG